MLKLLENKYEQKNQPLEESPSITLVDFRKAYDTVDREFLEAMLSPCSARWHLIRPDGNADRRLKIVATSPPQATSRPTDGALEPARTPSTTASSGCSPPKTHPFNRTGTTGILSRSVTPATSTPKSGRKTEISRRGLFAASRSPSGP
jgi:hypothetical protein